VSMFWSTTREEPDEPDPAPQPGHLIRFIEDDQPELRFIVGSVTPGEDESELIRSLIPDPENQQGQP
jgi:hypothetical protein